MNPMKLMQNSTEEIKILLDYFLIKQEQIINELQQNIQLLESKVQQQEKTILELHSKEKVDSQGPESSPVQKPEKDKENPQKYLFDLFNLNLEIPNFKYSLQTFSYQFEEINPNLFLQKQNVSISSNSLMNKNNFQIKQRGVIFSDFTIIFYENYNNQNQSVRIFQIDEFENNLYSLICLYTHSHIHNIRKMQDYLQNMKQIVNLRFQIQTQELEVKLKSEIQNIQESTLYLFKEKSSNTYFLTYQNKITSLFYQNVKRKQEFDRKIDRVCINQNLNQTENSNFILDESEIKQQNLCSQFN
ncbi:hypothetical protein ABPG73_008305 [Tetrahymena malaccensis]